MLCVSRAQASSVCVSASILAVAGGLLAAERRWLIDHVGVCRAHHDHHWYGSQEERYSIGAFLLCFASTDRGRCFEDYYEGVAFEGLQLEPPSGIQMASFV